MNTRKHRSPPPASPPRLARVILSLILPGRYRDNQVGDLAEEFRTLADAEGVVTARRWYRRQVLSSFKSNLTLRFRERSSRSREGGLLMETLWQDIGYGLRSLKKSPGYAVISALALALAIGVNTAIFSLVNIVAFQDLPMQDDETLGFLSMNDAATGQFQEGVSFQDLVDLRRDQRSFEGLSGLMMENAILTGGDEPERVAIHKATDNFLGSWRVPMALGRDFLPGEDRPGAAPVVLLSYGFWEERFGGDPDVLGQTLRIDGSQHTIVGVVSSRMEFASLGLARLWLPLDEPETGGDREARTLLVSGRLLPGVTVEQADEDITALGEHLSELYPETNGNWNMHVVDTRTLLLGDELPAILLLLGLTGGFVLMIACANVANMLLARSPGRSRELAVRVALGASRLRIIRQLLTESVLVATSAGVMGLAMAHGLMRLLVAITRGREALFTTAIIDRHVLTFTLIVTLAAPVIFGLIPALRGSRTDVSATLKDGGVLGASGRKGGRLRGALVISQMALALILMVVAGVSTRTNLLIQTIDRGYEGTGVLSMVVDLPESGYAEDQRARQFFDELLATAVALPDVEGIALVNTRPGVTSQGSRFEIEGRPVVDERDQPRAVETVISRDYLDVLRVPLLRGRSLELQDNGEAPPVVIVSLAAAEKYWPGGNPIGQRILPASSESEDWLTIVGIAGGTEYGPGPSIEHVPQIYLPLSQTPRRRMVLLARTRGEPTEALAGIKNAVRSVDPAQPVDDVRTMEQYKYDSSSFSLALLTLAMTFAVFALVMAGLGIYGVMSYMVSERKAAISLRMALGAQRGDVLRMVLYKGGTLMTAGAAVGIVGALLLSPVLESMVVGISPRDPVTFIGVPAALMVVALVANYIPAFRATRVDPMSAMRKK